MNIYKESVSSVVYHALYLDNLIQVLHEDRFLCNISQGADNHELITQSVFYFPVSRVKWGGYFESEYKYNESCILELDGNKFNQKYKGGAYDYWGYEYRKKKLPDLQRFVMYDENEERVYSQTLYIPNAHKYIKSIHIYIANTDKGLSDDTIKKVKKLLPYTEKYKIPIFYYKKLKDFKLLRNGLPFTSESFSNVGLPAYVLLADILSHTSIKDVRNESKRLIRYFQNVGKIYDNDIIKIVSEIKTGHRFDELDKLYIYAIEQIQRFMKKNKIRNLYGKEFINAVKNHIIQYYL